eukprot:3811190-Alexandrium_andersonii.AAC.1
MTPPSITTSTKPPRWARRRTAPPCARAFVATRQRCASDVVAGMCTVWRVVVAVACVGFASR